MKSICITGLDGCGKSTQALLLTKKLKNSRIVSVWDIIKRQEFQNWTIYKNPPPVEKYVAKLHPVSRSLFIFHAFNEAYQTALKSKANYLIFDGYWYKYWAVELAMKSKKDLTGFWQKQYLIPDYTFYLKLDISEIIKRKKNISEYEGGLENNRLQKFISIQQKTKGYIEKLLPENHFIIDGNQKTEIIHQQIYRIVKE
jgi:thymidylate kinase